jgi:hypothetical protein
MNTSQQEGRSSASRRSRESRRWLVTRGGDTTDVVMSVVVAVCDVVSASAPKLHNRDTAVMVSTWVRIPPPPLGVSSSRTQAHRKAARASEPHLM